MIKSIKFENFRNLDAKYNFDNNLNIIVGKNNSGKTNLLDGIRLAFSTITDDYFKVEKSDFNNSDDSKPITIIVELAENSINSLMEFDENGKKAWGFRVKVRKTQRGRYVKEICSLSGSNIDYEILKEDPSIPTINSIPLARIDSLFTNGYAVSMSNFLKSDEDYNKIKNKSKDEIKKQLNDKINEFQKFCQKFGQCLDIEFADPKLTDEKIYVVENETGKEHCYRIGSGYRSIANIIINTLNKNNNIILIDEIENHLHPALIRTLIREIYSLKNVKIIGTTHSAVVLNELPVEEIIEISGIGLNSLNKEVINKLNIFLHPGRSELILADNIILVEGYTEELLLKNYLYKNNYNWTVINVAGVMFEPYISLCSFLNKKTVVISDNDKSLNDGINPSTRFTNLKSKCDKASIKLIEIDNTLETDLHKNGYLSDFQDYLTVHQEFNDITIAKQNKKTEIAIELIKREVDLSDWHVVRGLLNEFGDN